MIILHNHHVMEMTIIFNSKVLEDDDELVEEEEADGGGAEEEGFHLLLWNVIITRHDGGENQIKFEAYSRFQYI